MSQEYQSSSEFSEANVIVFGCTDISTYSENNPEKHFSRHQSESYQVTWYQGNYLPELTGKIKDICVLHLHIIRDYLLPKLCEKAMKVRLKITSGSNMSNK